MSVRGGELFRHLPASRKIPRNNTVDLFRPIKRPCGMRQVRNRKQAQGCDRQRHDPVQDEQPPPPVEPQLPIQPGVQLGLQIPTEHARDGWRLLEDGYPL